MRAAARRHPLVLFFLLAYGLSWAYWVPMAVRGMRVVPGAGPSHLPGLLGPALAAFATPLLLGDRAGVRELGRRLVRISPPSWRFWAIALSPLALLALALVAGGVSGAGLPALASFERYSGLRPLPLPLVFLTVLMLNGFGEETGWRGFALPRLQARFGPLGGTLVLAALWAGWHAPMFFVVETYRQMPPMVLLFGFGLGILSGALVLSHVAHLTRGSVLAAAFWHASYNMSSATEAGRGLVAAVTTTGVMLWAAAVLVAELRRGRRGSQLDVAAE